MSKGSASPRLAFVGRYSVGERLSGPEKVARRIYDTIRLRPGIDAEFFTYFFDGAIHGRARKLVGCMVDEEKGVSTLGLARQCGALARFDPDALVIVNFERFVLLPLTWARRRNLPVLYLAHSLVAEENERLRRHAPRSMRVKDAATERRLFENSDTIIFVSDENRKHALRQYRVQGETAILPNGVDAVFFDGEGEDGAQIGRSENDPLRIAFTGGWSRPEKGWDFLARALDAVRAPVEVHVIDSTEHAGTGARHASVRRSDPMNTDALAAWLRGMDCFICASSFESFSISTAEAMASALPVLVTRESGISRLIRDEENGLLVSYGDAAALAYRIERLHADASLRRTLGRAARDTAASLTWDRVTDLYIREIEGMLQRKRRAGAGELS